MNKKLLVLAIGIIAVSQLSIFGQTVSAKFSRVDFDSKDLTASGQSAYKTLLTTRAFTLSGRGAVAAPYPQTLALVTLLAEKKAAKALQSIIRNAHLEGQVYGLLGLQVINSKEFKSDFKVFRNLFSESENQRQVINSEDGGCDSEATTLKRIDVINDLKNGSLATVFRLRFPEPK